MEFLPLIGKVRMGFKQSLLTLTLSPRGRGKHIRVLSRAKVNSPERGNNINFPQRTYSPIDLFTSSLKKKHAAFTLAEVLITLGITGVVAVLTLSTVIQNIQNKQNIAKWKKEYSVINNAFNEVVADGVSICDYNLRYGNCGGSGYTDEFISAIQTKLRVVDYCGTVQYVSSDKLCDNYPHFSPKDIKYKWAGIVGTSTGTRYKPLGGSQGSSINYYNFSRLAILLNDGAAVYFGELWNGPWILVDVNNFNKGPNEFGRDVFVIHVSSNIKTNKHYLSPAGSDSLFEEMPQLNNSGYGITGCSKDIGTQTSNTVYEVAGSGCSAKYLLE